MIKYRDGAIDRLNEAAQKKVAEDNELIHWIRYGGKKPSLFTKTLTVPSSEDN